MSQSPRVASLGLGPGKQLLALRASLHDQSHAWSPNGIHPAVRVWCTLHYTTFLRYLHSGVV